MIKPSSWMRGKHCVEPEIQEWTHRSGEGGKWRGWSWSQRQRRPSARPAILEGRSAGHSPMAHKCGGETKTTQGEGGRGRRRRGEGRKVEGAYILWKGTRRGTWQRPSSAARARRRRRGGVRRRRRLQRKAKRERAGQTDGEGRGAN